MGDDGRAVSDFEQAQQTEFLRSFSRVAVLVSLGFATSYWFGLQLYPGAVILGACGAGFASLPALARRRSMSSAGHAAAALIVVAVSYVCSVRADLPLAALVFLSGIPLVTSYLSGTRAAVGWALVVALVCAVVTVRVETGLAQNAPQLLRPEVLAMRTVFDAFGFVSMLAMMTGLALSIERRRARVEAERLKLTDALGRRHANARVGRLAAGVAHEINNPLAWMTSGVSYLKSRARELLAGPERAEFDEVISELDEGLVRVGALVADLQCVARADEAVGEGADLHRVLHIVRGLGNVRSAKSGALRITSPDTLPRVHANEGALAELLLELVLECEGPQVELAVSVEAGRVRFTVTPLTGLPLERARELLGAWQGDVTATDAAVRLELPPHQ